MRTLKRNPDTTSRTTATTPLALRGPTYRGPMLAEYRIPGAGGAPGQAITAAAEIVYGKNVAKSKKRPPLAAWQREAWELRNEIPEFRFAGDRVARGCGRFKLFIAKRPDTAGAEPTRVTEGPAYDVSEMLFGDLSATQHGLYNAARHLTFNGESMLIISDTENGYSWKPASVTELTGQGKSWKRNNGIESTNLNIDRDRVVRCWRPDPEFSGLADCPARAVLPVARTLRGLAKRTAAEIDSRLAGAGVVLFPDDATVMPGQGQTDLVEAFVESMLTPIQDPESAAALVPLILKMRAESIEKVKHISFATPLDEKLPEMESNAIRRIGLGMDSPPETLLGISSANHWCTDDTTEILTQDRGWITHVQLQTGDIVLTLNHDTNESEWQPVEEIYRAAVTDEPMLRMKGLYHDSLTTPNHRWPVLSRPHQAGTRERKWLTTETLGKYSQLVRAAANGHLPDTAKYDDAFVELVAWFITEGTCTWPSENHCQVRIGQSHKANPEHVAAIRAVHTRLYGPASETMNQDRNRPQWREAVEDRGMTLFHLNATARDELLQTMESRHSKVVTRDFIYALTKDQLDLFLHVCSLGDGDVRNRTIGEINQRDAARLAPLELAAILAGHGVTTRVRQTGGFERKDQHFLSIGDRYNNLGAPNRADETYTGTIWCPTTRNHSWLARRNGTVYFTGNTGWLISSEEVSLVLSPTVATVCHSLTTGFVTELLEAYGVEDASDHMVWFDASELELRPDKSTDSRDLHSKDVLSDEAMLRENGFSKEDMPDDAEKRRRLLERLVVADPSLAPTILPELGIELDFQAWTGGTPTSPGTDPDGTDEHPAGEHEPPVQPTDPPDDTIETGPGQ